MNIHENIFKFLHVKNGFKSNSIAFWLIIVNFINKRFFKLIFFFNLSFFFQIFITKYLQKSHQMYIIDFPFETLLCYYLIFNNKRI